MSLSNEIIEDVQHLGFTLSSDGKKPDLEGDLCDLYRCKRVITPLEVPVVIEPEPENVWERLMGPADAPTLVPGEVPAFLKMPRSLLDNDLVRQEANLLTHLWQGEEEETQFLRYIPRLMASFTAQSRHYNIVSEAQGYISLADVMQAYPDGLDYRDVAWMLKRVLSGIGYAHELGVIHGALVPSHILVHPTGHGAKLIDWSYGVRVRDRMSIRAYVAAYREIYPPEVFEKRYPSPATDLYMIGQCFHVMLNDEAPKEVCDFLEQFIQEKSTDRPQDHAWNLHDDFDRILHRLVGKPKYRPLAMPPVI